MGFFLCGKCANLSNCGCTYIQTKFSHVYKNPRLDLIQVVEIARNFYMYIFEKLLLWWCLTWIDWPFGSKSQGKSSQNSWGWCMASILEIWKNQVLQCFRQSIDCVFPIPKTGVLARKEAHSSYHFHYPRAQNLQTN